MEPDDPAVRSACITADGEVSVKGSGKSESERQGKTAREKHHGLARGGLRPGDKSEPTIVTDHSGVGRTGKGKTGSRPATRKKV
jgi:hypothetical protein